MRAGAFAAGAICDIEGDSPRKDSTLTDSSNIKPFGRKIPFTIDGKPFTTDDPSQRASALLRLVELDPAIFDLGELVDKENPRPKRYHDDEIVEVTKDARFVSIRQKAPVA